MNVSTYVGTVSKLDNYHRLQYLVYEFPHMSTRTVIIFMIKEQLNSKFAQIVSQRSRIQIRGRYKHMRVWWENPKQCHVGT